MGGGHHVRASGVTQCADTTQTAFGFGSRALSPSRVSVNALCSIAFIGDPCPTNRTGIFSNGALLAKTAHAVRPHHNFHVNYLIIAKGKIRCSGALADLLQISLVGVVVEAESQRKIRSIEFGGQRGKRIRRRDAAPCRAIERNVSGSGDQSHIRDLAIRRNGKLNHQLTLLHLGRFRNRTIPMLPNVLQKPLQIGAEVDALGIAENLQIPLLPGRAPPAQTKVALLAASACAAAAAPSAAS